jgi:hypothetical protein
VSEEKNNAPTLREVEARWGDEHCYAYFCALRGEDAAILIPCCACDGSGERDYWCEDCHGEGAVDVECDECGGEGHVPCGECDGTKKCKKCHGEGETEEDCDECDGSGDVKGACDACDGKKTETRIARLHPADEFTLERAA